MNKPSVADVDIRIIKPEELKYEYPKEPFMRTPTSEVYRGEYHGFQVAIKRFIDQANTSPRSAPTILTFLSSEANLSLVFPPLAPFSSQA